MIKGLFFWSGFKPAFIPKTSKLLTFLSFFQALKHGALLVLDVFVHSLQGLQSLLLGLEEIFFCYAALALDHGFDLRLFSWWLLNLFWSCFGLLFLLNY